MCSFSLLQRIFTTDFPFGEKKNHKTFSQHYFLFYVTFFILQSRTLSAIKVKEAPKEQNVLPVNIDSRL